MMPYFPNLFTILGPNSAGLGSALEMIEAQTSFATKFISHVEAHKFKYMYPKTKAVESWLELVSKGFSETIMNAGCTSWWTDKDGYNHAVWPYGTMQFKEMVNALKPDDFEKVAI
ncbi:MAG: hypothetical protein IPM37_13600 [Hahellaceae bacterium]|nr:hypothetical protein [Hahellaceae bacterium]